MEKINQNLIEKWEQMTEKYYLLNKVVGPEAALDQCEMTLDFLEKHGLQSTYYYGISLNDAGYYNVLIGDFKEAEEYYRFALNVIYNTEGSVNKYFALVTANLAELYFKQEEFAMAEIMLFNALSIRKEVFGEKTEPVAEILNNLAMLFSTIGEKESAEKAYFESLEITEKEFGKNSLEYTYTLSNLADHFFEYENYKKAIIYYKSVIDLYFGRYGEKESLIYIYDKLLNCYKYLGDPASVSKYKKIIEEIKNA
jgi:tetratricopeptide (TPR) repeat protein